MDNSGEGVCISIPRMWITPENGGESGDGFPDRDEKTPPHEAEAFSIAGRQRQRVVIRKPIRAIPRPISRFQDCRPGIGYCMLVM